MKALPIKGFWLQRETSWLPGPAAALALPYCNLRCPWCRERDLILNPDSLPTYELAAITDQLIKGPAQEVVVTGGEPLMHPGLISLLEPLKHAGLSIFLETNGTQPEFLEHLIERKLVDRVALDVKGPLDDALYEQGAGVCVPVDIIHMSLSILASSGIPFFLTACALPGPGSDERIHSMARDLASYGPMSLHPFINQTNLEPEWEKTEPMPLETMSRLQALAKAAGGK